MNLKKISLSAFFLLLLSGSAMTQNWGVGLRLGDPSGITVKKYLGGSALELSVGRSHLFYNRGFYGNNFDKWYQKKNYNHFDYQYVGYRRFTPVAIQLHYLIQKDLGESLNTDLGGLEWYFGFGGQLRFQSYYYDYRYKVNGTSGWVFVEGERITDIDLGVDGVLGLEYTLEEVPISFFLDATLFVELIDNPFLFWGQAGFGVRYRF